MMTSLLLFVDLVSKVAVAECFFFFDFSAEFSESAFYVVSTFL